jgi:serpin B
MARLERRLETIDLEPWYKFAVANALWGQEGLRYKDEFLALMESEYEASFHDVDFGRVEKTRRIINAWVKEQTEEKIQNLISPGALIPGTVLVLTNAIYFKGEWQAHFTVRMTQDEPFHLIGGAQVTVPLMKQVHIFPYADLDSLKVLELPYGSGDLTMFLALPKDVRGLPSLERSLSGDVLDMWISELQQTEVQVFLPRFSITQAFNLNEVMQSLGMRKAFSLSADFSGMVDGLIYVYAILHKAFIDTDEHGTEAAAATSIKYMCEIRGVDLNRMPPVFRADHPFLFLIRHRPSGCILFMGRVLDPTQ